MNLGMRRKNVDSNRRRNRRALAKLTRPKLRGLETLECRRLLDGHGLQAEIVISDVDGDGEVGFGDFVELVKHFGDKVARGHGDIDGDGSVDSGDIESIVEHFGKVRPNDLPEDAKEFITPRGIPQAQLASSRFIQLASDIVESLGRGRKEDAPAILEVANNAQAVFYPVLQAGSATGTPTDSPSNRIDQNVGSEYGGVGSIEVVHPTLGSFMCTGTVISPTHVLTAGHCFDVESDGVPDVGATGTFNLNDGSDFSSTHTVSSINTHPDFTGFAAGGNDDLAILELATPVPSSTPMYSVRVGDMVEGETLQMVGYGQSGDGDTGFTVTPSFSQKRLGGNQADLFIVDDEGSGVDEVFFFDFDEPTGTSVGNFGGTTLGNDIETIVGGGDSGGPSFVDFDGEKVIAGLNTFNWELLGTTPPAGFFGSLGGGVILAPYVDWIASISPNAIDSNDAPSFTAGADVTVVEDSAAQSIAWATDIDANNQAQTVEFHVVSNSNPDMFSVLPEIAPNGTLTFTAKPDFYGTAELTVVLQDDGGTAYNGQDTSASHTLLINVSPVNDAPSFSVGADIVLAADAGLQAISGFASDFDAGPEESDQTVVEYIVTNDNAALFAQQPQVNASGELTFNPLSSADGLANISIQVRDSGGTADGGVDTSAVLPFSITVEPVDPPGPPVDPLDLSFTLSGDVELEEDTKKQVNGFASGIGSDVKNFQVTTDNESLFQVQPRINPAGKLQFVPKEDAWGTVNVDVVAVGDGDESDPKSFQISISPINDAPSVTILGDIKLPQGSGAHSISDFASDFDPGNSYESGQGIQEFVLKYDNALLFTVPPSIGTDGVLSFELADKAGTANVVMAVVDTGGTANGGQNTSERYEFSINAVPDLETPPKAVIRNGLIVLKGTGQQMLGIKFHSDAGLLSNGSSAAPFGFYLSETPTDVALGVLGPDNAVTLDGELVTSIRYSGTNPDTDLTAAWGDAYGSSAELEVELEASDVDAVVRNGRIVVRGTDQDLLGLQFKSKAGLLSSDPSADPFGFYLSQSREDVSLGILGAANAVNVNGELRTPVMYSGMNPETDVTAAWGGIYGTIVELPVTVEVPDITAVVRNGRIVLEGAGQQMVGLEFKSEAGLLSNSPSTEPFDFYLSESPENVSLGVLGAANAVTLNGSVTTSVSYSGLDPANDLTARWGDITGSLFDIKIEVESPTLSGFIDADNYIVLQGIGQEVLGVDFKSPDGLLVPLEDGEEEPFRFALSNTKEHVSLGMLGETVSVDGRLRTNIQYLGDLDRLVAHWGGESGTEFDLPISRGNDICSPPSLKTLSDCADNLDERDAILAELGRVLGDLDDSGDVGFADFLMLAENFGKADQTYIDGDLDLNGKVTFGDFLLLADNFGKKA